MLVPGLEKQVGVRTFKAYQALEWLENNIKDKDPDFYDQSSLEDSFDILKNECSISKIWIAMLTINTNKIGNQFGPSTSIIDCMQDVSIPSNSSRILRQFLRHIKPFLPKKFRNVNCMFDTQTEVGKSVNEYFAGMVRDMFIKLEVYLTANYIKYGDNRGKTFMTILEKRFRDNWAPISRSAQIEATTSNSNPEDSKLTITITEV